MVRNVPKKYGCALDKQTQTTEAVLRQAERLCADCAA